MRRLGKPAIERKKKQIIKVFQKHGLKILIQANLLTAEYLDVEFNLMRNSYRPYRKPNSAPLYIHTQSNHPPSVLKQVPKSIAQRLSDISSSEDIFKQAAPEYQNALQCNGFTDKLLYEPSSREERQTVNADKKRRKRKVIFYNPPYSVDVQTNIGKTFIRLVRKHFKPTHRLYKIFNDKTLKLSYCCMPNVATIISGHNKSILRKAQEPEEQKKCNCSKKIPCPMNGECLTRNVTYEAEVTTDSDTRIYVGCTKRPWKDRYAVHKTGFKHRSHAGGCELTKYIWTLKDAGRQYSIKWRILEKVRGRLIGGECKLCIAEKMHIIFHPQKDLLINSRTAIMCKHKSDWMLSSLDENKPKRGRPKGSTNIVRTNDVEA